MSAELPPLAVQVEDAGPCSKKVRITVPAARVDREIEETFKNVSRAVQFKGFRPGKAPRKLVEARLGDRVMADVKERLVQNCVEEALRDGKLDTLGEAEADWEKIAVSRGAEMTFEVTVDVRPEFTLPELAELTVERPVLVVTDEHVDRELARLRRERATVEDAGDAPLEEGGTATLAVRLECEGQVVVDETGIEWEHPSDVLGGMLVTGMAAGLVGKAKGAGAEFDVTLPENFRDDALRGKPAKVAVTLETVQRVVLPELNDSFAAELDYDDVAELRDDVRKRLERNVAQTLDRALDERIVEALLAAVPFELPPSLVKRETGRMLARYQTRLRQDGLPEQQIGEELARAYAEAETRVKHDVRASFVLDRVATSRKVFATETEVAQEISRMSVAYDRTPEEMEDQMREQGLLPSLRASLRERKTLAELRKLVKVTEPAAPAAEGGAA